MNGYKVLTHDLRRPLFRMSKPLEIPHLPLTLPRVELDKGWSFYADLHTALRVSGLWPGGWSSRVWEIEANDTAIRWGHRCRAAQVTLVRELTDAEINTGIEWMSGAFGAHSATMAREQILWREALARPDYDVPAVEDGLREVLAARDLNWKIKRVDSTRSPDWVIKAIEYASTAGAAKVGTVYLIPGAIWTAWATGAEDASAAYYASADHAAREITHAWGARSGWNAYADGAACDALTLQYAALNGWIGYSPDLLTVGIRDACRCGMETALPRREGELGYTMAGDEPSPGER